MSSELPVPDLVLRPGDLHDRVPMWRERMRRLGYEVPRDTGKFFDVDLEIVTKRFQRDNDLPVTGIVDERTLQTARHKTEPKGMRL